MLVAHTPGCATYCRGGRWLDGGGKKSSTQCWVFGSLDVRASISVNRLDDSYAKGEERPCISSREKVES